MWGGAWCWDIYRPFFEQRGYRVITPTLRHHGQDDVPPPPELGRVGLLDFAADLEDEIRSLDKPPVLVGHSMGGLLAQMLAARGLASAVVCLTPAPPMGILAVRHPSVAATFIQGIGRIVRRKPVRPRYWAADFAVFNELPEAESRRLYDLSVYESGRAISEIGLRTYRSLIPYLDPLRASAVDERKVTCPMLVVGARHDRITPLPIAEKVARKYGADYIELDDHAHWILTGPNWRGPAERVAAWLDA